MSFLIFSVTADDEAQYNPPTPPHIHPRVVLDLKSLCLILILDFYNL